MRLPLIVRRKLAKLSEFPNNPNKHTLKQIKKLAAIMRRLGFIGTIVIDENNVVLAGHLRRLAAIMAGIDEVDCVLVGYLTEAEKRAFALSDNRISEESVRDTAKLSIQINEILTLDPDFDVTLTAYDADELDRITLELSPEDKGPSPKDEALPLLGDGPTVSKVGDLIQLGNHRIYCGDSRLPTSFAIVMGGQLAVLIISDAPYNVPISGHVGGSGKIKHHEFVQGAGELTDAAFVSLLSDVVANLVTFSVPGSLHLHFMDWRHFRQILDAAEPQYERLMNVIVWDKNVGGMGTFYRSRHEEIFIFKKGGAAHINNFGLGAKGRYRTNVWNYRGLNSGGAGRLEELAIHPTAKPVRMLADAMIDLSAPNSIVLDPYGGSGSTLIAAEKTGRRARIIELDPIYVDRMVRRFQKYTKQDALFADTGETFSARERRLKASRALAARIVRPGSTPSSRIVDFTFEEVA